MGETISAVASVERETNQVNAVRDQLQHILQDISLDDSRTISKMEFAAIVKDPYATKALQSVGVDAVGLVESADAVFKHEEELDFKKILELLLEMRGGNSTR